MEIFFTYFIKASALLTLFYVSYWLLLKKETFFSNNRWFLLIGLITSILLPFITITKTIWIDSEPLIFQETVFPSNFQQETVKNYTPAIESKSIEINWSTLVTGFYFLGMFFFLIKLILSSVSLYKILYKFPVTKQNKYKFIDNKNIKTPFSFFNYIAFDSSSFSEEELQNIITHEKIHSKQKHSLDVLFSELVSVIFWFHPLIWLYKRSIIQNLEFIADSKTIQIITSKINYQKTLLKITLQPQNLILVNPFFQPLIKKRIMMLNKNKSRKFQLWKYVIILPILMLFVVQFQTQVIAQTKEDKSTPSFKEHSNQIFISGDTIFWVKDFKEGYHSTDNNDKLVIKEGSLEDGKKDLEKPMYIINGEEIPKELTNSSWNLEGKVTVIEYNEKEAVEKFGEKGKNGIILIQGNIENISFQTKDNEIIKFLKITKDYKQIDIFDRFGRLVYSLKSGDKLEEEKINSFKDGTYFYVIEMILGEKISGYLEKGDTVIPEQRAREIKQQRAKQAEVRAKDAEQRTKQAQVRTKDTEQRVKERQQILDERKTTLEERKKEIEDRIIRALPEKPSFSIVINKNTTDQEIKEYISQFKSNQNVEMKISNIKRNKNKEIYKIKISLSENSEVKENKKESKITSTFERNNNSTIPEILIEKRNGNFVISDN